MFVADQLKSIHHLYLPVVLVFLGKSELERFLFGGGGGPFTSLLFDIATFFLDSTLNPSFLDAKEFVETGLEDIVFLTGGGGGGALLCD